MARRTPISHKAMAEFGWTRVDPRPWRAKTDAVWEHPSGWKVKHCGHPTALRPWMIFDPDERLLHLERDLRSAAGWVRDERAARSLEWLTGERR